MKTRHLAMLIALTAACGDARVADETTGTPESDPEPEQAESAVGPVVADLRADTNRDGVIRFDDPGDERDEDSWGATHGAVFLANIDDDQEKCPTNVDDVELPRCHDAADEVVNGAEDAKDLARLKTRPWPAAPSGARATLTWNAAAQVRLFKMKGAQLTRIESGHLLSRSEVAAGVELAIEARDIVRDTSVWNGLVDVTFKVRAEGKTGTDVVRLRVSPVMTFHHLLRAETTFVSSYPSSGNAALRADLAAAASAAGVDPPVGISVDDPWAQDFFETGFMSMPAPNGKQHVIRVAIRSANVFEPQSSRNPLRPAGRVAFLLRGKDSAAIQQFERNHDPNADTLNSFGNFETVPPYTHAGASYPLGRMLQGSVPSFQTDRAFQRMIDAQKVQPPILLDTSWLLVGHVDETMSFVKASSARGWVLLANDPTLAANMLVTQSNAGRGNLRMFTGKYWDESSPAQVTIDQVLSDPDVMGASSEAAVEVAAQLAKMKAETGLTNAEIVKVPFLHMSLDGLSIAFQPGTVNGLYLTEKDFVAPAPHGPVVDGQDIFRVALRDSLAPLGITARFAEDWDDYHRNMGEVHCGTNTIRAIPQARWWESGR